MATAPDVPHFARLTILVDDLDRARRFYGELLGIEGKAVGGGRVYFTTGPVIFAVMDPAGGGMMARPSSDALYFTVRDVKAVHERATTLKCLDSGEVHGEAAGAIVKRPWGERSFYAADPWGNRLCFIETETLFRGR